MLNTDEESTAFLAKLRRELEWLKCEHPAQTALIAIAEAHLKLAEQNGDDIDCAKLLIATAKPLSFTKTRFPNE